MANPLDPNYWLNILNPANTPGYGVLAPPGGTSQTAPTVAGIMTGTLPQSAQISGPVAVTAVQSGANLGPTPPPPPPPGQVRPGIASGGSPQVWDLQSKLNSMGAKLTTDGLMGPMTRAAMSQYGLDPNGNPVAAAPTPSGGSAPAPGGAGLTGVSSSSSSSTDFLNSLLQQLGPTPAMPSFDPTQVAKDQIQLQYGAQEDALKNALAQLGISYAGQRTEQETFGKEASSRLQNVFDALKTNLNADQAQTGSIYDTARGNIGSSYDEAGQRLQSTGQDIVGSLLSNADRLGIAQGAGTPLARIMELYAQMSGSNTSRKATSLAGLDMDKANSLALGQSKISSSERQGAQAQTDLAQQVQSALSQLGLQNSQQSGQMYQQQASLEGNKAADYRNNVMQLNQSLYNMQRQSRLDQLAEMVQLGTLDTQRQKLAMTANGTPLDWAKLAETSRATDLAHQLDPLKGEQLGGAANLANARADYYANGGSAANKGLHGDLLEQFLQTPQQGLWGDAGAGPAFSGVVNDLINQANMNKQNLGVDPLQWALSQAPTAGASAGHPDLNLQGIITALQRYYKGI